MVLFAQTRDVWGTYTYYSDPSQSFKAAKAAAIQHARTQVLAQEFGTLLTQSTLQQEAMKNGEENSYFMQLSEAEVKGKLAEANRRLRVCGDAGEDMMRHDLFEQ